MRAFAVDVACVDRDCVPTLAANIARHGAELVAAVRAGFGWLSFAVCPRHLHAVDSDNAHLIYGHSTALHVIAQMYPLATYTCDVICDTPGVHPE